jgi:arylsulfatase A-like enzyme
MRFQSIFLAAITFFLIASPVHANANKPNVIFILADDLGWTDLACYGSKYYETPNLDKLAAEGMKFTNGYACGPNCAPTRAALLSGQYGPRTGIYTVGNIDRFDWQSRPLRPVDNTQQLPIEKVTVAQAMKNAGYATAMFGKWHLGGGEQFHPSKRGFDEAIESSGQHFDFKTDPQTEYPKGTYLADFLTDRAIDFIGRNKEKPFFLYLPHFGVHAPYQAKPELIEKFSKKPGVGGHNNPTYAAMIYSVDESVGRIVAELEKLGLAKNTLVVFTSDNGGIGGYSRAGVQAGKETTDNAPLKGGKGMLYEGGIRVPYIFRWPGKIAPGTTNDQPICSVDLYPTLLEFAAAAPAKDYTLDGVSYVSTLMTGKPLDREAIYWHFPGYLGAKADSWRTKPCGAIRMGDFALLEFFEDGALELYNLKEDIGQEKNLAQSDPERTKAMHEKLVAWRKATGAKMPTPITEADKQVVKKKGKKNRNNGDDE